MGGSDSKEEQAQPAIVSKNNKKSPRQVQYDAEVNMNSKTSPRNPLSKSKVNQSSYGQEVKNSRVNPNPNEPLSMSEQQFARKEGGEELSAEPEVSAFFQDWPQKFHQDGHIDLDIILTELKPSPELKTLQRRKSQHEGSLSWSYEVDRSGPEPLLCLRFILEETGGYTLIFLVNHESEAVQGDQQLWNLLCPFRVSEQTSKVGQYLCERVYQAQEEENEDEQTEQVQLFAQWGEKYEENREKMKKLLKQRLQEQNLKKNIGFEYRQSSKYFTSKNQWAYSVLVEEKYNTFKSWLLKQSENKDQAMTETLENDVENREKMYVQEMRKKSQSFKLLKKKQQIQRN